MYENKEDGGADEIHYVSIDLILIYICFKEIPIITNL